MLYSHDIFDSVPKIKGLNSFPKFASFDLRVIKEILDHAAHHIGRGVLDFETIIQLYENLIEFRRVDVILLQDSFQLLVQVSFQDVLGLE